MPQQYVTDSGVLIIPGAYPKTNVASNPGGIATTGILMVVGEAQGGADYSQEEDLSLNSYGPDQISDITAKYGSGPLVDAFRLAVAASNDAGIVGSFSRFIPVKTNRSVSATGTIPAIGGGNYANILAKVSGKSGNLITRTLTAASSEVVPTTGSAIIAPPQVNTNIEFRVNGGAAVTASLTAADIPSAIRTAIDSLTGVAASGGVSRNVITGVAGSLTVAIVSGFTVTITITGAAYAALPTVGDILLIPTGSPLATANEGTYAVTAAAGAVITARKVLDASGAGSTLTAPSAEGPIVISAITDLRAFSPIVISNEAGVVVPGLGKSLEIANTSTGSFSDIAFSASGVAATWVSTSVLPVSIASGTEYSVNVNVARQTDAISDNVISGGRVVLAIGYTGTTASAVIASGVLTITVTGGAGANQTITLSDYPTINDLVTFINTFTGYSAAAGNATLGQRASTALDAGTYTIANRHGARNGRIKSDGASFLTDVNTGNILANVAAISPATRLVGLPDVSSLAFLSGGSKGGTTNANILGALDALAGVRGNFIVPCFSRDATLDIVDGLTEATSSYTIDSIHTNVRSHVLSMSSFKKRRPRQGFLSTKGTFAESKNKGANMASGRLSMSFQDVRDTNSAGNLVQFQPWAKAVKAAAMQAAGFYRPIVNKFVNVSGAIQAAGDFNDQNDTNLEDALSSGLLIITRDEAGGYRWVSDQTTYTIDDNFVYNSIQAVYVSDVISQTTARRMEKAFVGQSVADISASLALTTLESIMIDLGRLKLIAPSSDAGRGFKDAKIKISGGAMVVSVTVKLAGAIYFIPITFLVTPVQQSAG